MTSDKKLDKREKKLKKIQQRVQNSGFEFSDQPSRFLFLGNGGVVCGFTTVDLEVIAARYGSVRNVMSWNDKSYSVIEFDCAESAENFRIGEERFYCAHLARQPTFSKREVSLPEGLEIIEEFISEDIENEIVSFLETCTTACTQQLKRRSTFHFGYRFLYENGANRAETTPLSEEIPECISQLMKRIAQDVSDFEPDQVTVNVYSPGQGIPQHVDTHSAFGGVIASVSLSSAVVMQFRRGEVGELEEGAVEEAKGDAVDVLLPRRSLLLMSGEARYGWTHGIASRMNDVLPATGEVVQRRTRISVTFRKVKRDAWCGCGYGELCDVG